MRKVRSWYEPNTKEVGRLNRYDKGKENLDNSDQFKLRCRQIPPDATKGQERDNLNNPDN